MYRRLGQSGLLQRRRQLGAGMVGGGGGLLPLPSLTSPVFAYDAQDAASLWQDSAHTTTPAEFNNDVVGAWRQVAGYGSTWAVQTSGTPPKPLLKLGANGINGKPALSFGGTNYLNLTGITQASGVYTFYLVAQPASVGGTLHYYFDTATGRITLCHETAVAGQTGYFDGVFVNAGAATTTAQLLTYTLGSGAGTVYRNGALVGSGAYTNRAIGGNVALGAINTGAGQFYTGLIGAIYCQAAVVPAERALMEAYLIQRWGIS